MPKRVAGNQLTHENWNDEDDEAENEGGEVGIPVATADEMKGRVIKVARRRGIGASAEAAPTKSAFAGFGGFGALKPQTTAFSSIASTTKPEVTSSQTTNGSTSKDSSAEKKTKSSEYYSKLRALNESVSSWIKQHVDKNPYCLLSPVFRDYEKHLAAIEKSNEESSAEAVSSSSTETADGKTTATSSDDKNKHVSFNLATEKKDDAVKETAKPTFQFGSTSAPQPSSTSSSATGLFSLSSNKTESETVNGGTKTSDSAEKPKFSFGFAANTDNQKSESSDKFTFGAKPSTTETAGKFSFGTTTTLGGAGAGSGFSFGGATGFGAKPFSFASGASTTTTPATDAAEGEEEYVPPKPEVVEVKEDGAFYSKRCKLFWMKEGQWKEKGLGNLHLKKLDSGKTQLIIRADTNLGTILLNIMLAPSIPTSKAGKNMVTMICVPSPPFEKLPEGEEPKPEKLLLKVKTSEDADEMLAKLDEAKQ